MALPPTNKKPPIDETALLARVKSVLRQKQWYDHVQEPADDLARWNKTPEQRVSDQLAEIERISRLAISRAPRVSLPPRND